MDDVGGFSLGQCHVQRRQYQVGRRLLTNRPANDTAAPDIENDGQVDCVFRLIVTDRFGVVTTVFGIVTDRNSIVTGGAI